MSAADAGVHKPSANRPAVPSRDFLMIRFSNLVLSVRTRILGLSARLVPQLAIEPYAPGPRSPVPKWQHSRELVSPAYFSPSFWLAALKQRLSSSAID